MSSSSASVRAKRWWKRASAGVKDKCSICLVRARLSHYYSSSVHRIPDLEVAIIKATSHDDTAIDYKNAGRVFAWARTSPSSSLGPLMWVLSHRMERTRSWVVALKGLMIAHGILLCSKDIPAVRHIGRLPFDLSTFRDHSSTPGKSWGFTAFVRSYFNFLDNRSSFLNYIDGSSRGQTGKEAEETEDEELERLLRLQRMQDLLDLLIQIRPYEDGMELPLILEAMDCIVIEIFDVYSGICDGIARSLVGIFGSSSYCSRKKGAGAAKALLGVRLLKRATKQSSQLSNYFKVCRGLGVVNAADLPAVESVPEEDILELERLIMEGISQNKDNEEVVIDSRNMHPFGEEQIHNRGAAVEQETRGFSERGISTEGPRGCLITVVTKDWVVFDENFRVAKEEHSWNSSSSKNPLLFSTWEQRPAHGHSAVE